MNTTETGWRDRPSELELVASVWTCSPSKITPRTVLADPCTSIILVRSSERAKIVLRGPETKPRNEHYMPNTTWIGIRLHPGVKLKNFPVQQYINCSRSLPADSNDRFRFQGTLLQFPGFDNAEVLIERMCDLGLITGNPLSDQDSIKQEMTPKTYARFIKQNTGLSPYKLHQLQRMSKAFKLLQEGVSPAMVASELGFADQAHFHRAAKQFFGHTPKELLRWPLKP